jgi:rSAM/selenodomain-associated transferase 2
VTVSVVIPALDEEELLPGAIASVRDGALEIVVVDGGSSDRTRERAVASGARVVESPRGRGVQLDRGAREACGDLVVFLHADTRLEAGWREALLSLPWPAVGGAFRFALDTTRPGRRYAEWAVELRCRALGLPFGDQALFCRRAAYQAAGGFPHEPLFEDVVFMRRLRRLGPTVLLAPRAVTSARRWERDGALLTTLRNNALLLLFLAGVSPRRLLPIYEAGRPFRGSRFAVPSTPSEGGPDRASRPPRR